MYTGSRKSELNKLKFFHVWVVIQDTMGVSAIPEILIDCDKYDGQHLKVWNQAVFVI